MTPRHRQLTQPLPRPFRAGWAPARSLALTLITSGVSRALRAPPPQGDTRPTPARRGSRRGSQVLPPGVVASTPDLRRLLRRTDSETNKP